jgi:hypothetical protein
MDVARRAPFDSNEEVEDCCRLFETAVERSTQRGEQTIRLSERRGQ